MQLLAFLDDPLRRLHGAPAQPALDEVDVAALEARERRAEEREELAARPAEPREAQERRQRLAERRLRDAHLAVDRVRDAERAERGLERRAHAVDARADDADLLRRRSGAEQREQLFADELERAARAGALEEADGAVDRDRARATRPLKSERVEMRERGRRDVAVRRRELLDVAGRHALQDPPRCGEATRTTGRPGSYGSDTLTSVRPGERLEQRPLRPGQVLEAVGEDGLVVPRREVRLQPLGRAAAQQVAIPEPEPVELGAVRGVERSELALDLVGVEQARLELADRAQELVGEPAEPRRRGEPVQRGRRDDAPHEQCALRRGDDGPRVRRRRSAIRSKTSSNVPIVPPRSAGRRATSSRSTRSTSDRFGTMSTGSRSRVAR